MAQHCFLPFFYVKTLKGTEMTNSVPLCAEYYQTSAVTIALYHSLLVGLSMLKVLYNQFVNNLAARMEGGHIPHGNDRGGRGPKIL